MNQFRSNILLSFVIAVSTLGIQLPVLPMADVWLFVSRVPQFHPEDILLPLILARV